MRGGLESHMLFQVIVISGLKKIQQVWGVLKWKHSSFFLLVSSFVQMKGKAK